VRSQSSKALSRSSLAGQISLAMDYLFLESSALCRQRSMMGVAADSAVKRIQGSVSASGRQKYSHCLAEGRLSYVLRDIGGHAVTTTGPPSCCTRFRIEAVNRAARRMLGVWIWDGRMHKSLMLMVVEFRERRE